MHAYPLLAIVISYASHLVIETSQEISDVPYADYFTVEVGEIYIKCYQYFVV
jgi:hypothetical protein